MTSPCKGCPDRYPGCHDHCDKYQEWKAKYQEGKERSQKDRYTLYDPASPSWQRSHNQRLRDSLRGRRKYY